jgi:integrase
MLTEDEARRLGQIIKESAGQPRGAWLERVEREIPRANAANIRMALKGALALHAHAACSLYRLAARRGSSLALEGYKLCRIVPYGRAVDIVRGKLVVAEPKTDRSRRTIKLPARLLPELKQHRKEQAAMRLQLGLGKDSADLVFTSAEGEMLSPTALSVIFARQVRATGVKKTKFHGLRHLHITHLLRSGVPVHVVSARAGHARPSVTLDTYSHLLGAEDAAAADLADAMLRRALK